MKTENQCPKCGANLIIEFDYSEEPVLEICSQRPKCQYWVRLAASQEIEKE